MADMQNVTSSGEQPYTPHLSVGYRDPMSSDVSQQG